MSDFDELLKTLEAAADETDTLAKAIPAEDAADDDNIEDAADGEEGENPEDAEEGDDTKPMAKSMNAIVDGEEVEAIDATEILKSLHDRVDSNASVLAKALDTTMRALNSQNALIKSLSDKVEKLSGQGRGRKTVVTVHERQGSTMTKSEPDAVAPGQILAKALSAQAAGRLTASDVSKVETALNIGASVPADIVAKFN
jgi:hypothetical protein